MKMEKDEQLEQRFDEYFEESGTPKIDLSTAKRALGEERLRRSRRRRNIISAISACASLVLIVTLSVVFSPRHGTLPNPDDSAQTPPPASEPVIKGYSLAATKSRDISYAELSAEYGELVAEFRPFEFAENASCSYTVYESDGRAVLVCADLRYTGGLMRCDAQVYTDLTDGEYRADELAEYRTHGNAGGYRCKTEYLNGEYVSQIYWKGNAERYAVVTSPNEYGAHVLMEYFLK